MNLNRTYLFIAISSFALVIVLIIQVNWIFETAKIKEEIFNEKASMVLSRTAQAISADTATIKKMEISVGKKEIRKIDSLFNHFMKLYNVHIGYYFDVKSTLFSGSEKPFFTNNINANMEGCYNTCIKDGDMKSNKGVDLKLVFPDKDQYIIEEMGVPFISSVILIVVVLVLSWRTIFSLMKEKQISEHTTDFLNNMTHEFKTPLTNIALAGKLMIKESNIKQEDKIKHYSGIILEENDKLRLQVEQVLSMTALERGEIPLQKTELDLHHLIADALKCISVQVESKQGQIRSDLKANNIVVMGDKAHITNAICNLVDNAIKYSKEKPIISVHTFNAAQNIIVTISDTGIGIDSEYHYKVFDKFFRIPTGGVHDVKGFGLGLAYVKKIIELHQGKIELKSEKGKGTTFTITLPNA